jgi:sugar phosphate permease
METGTSRALWMIALRMVALSVMSYIGRTAMSITGSDIIKEFGLTETQMGMAFSVFLLGYTLPLAPGG